MQYVFNVKLKEGSVFLERQSSGFSLVPGKKGTRKNALRLKTAYFIFLTLDLLRTYYVDQYFL